MDGRMKRVGALALALGLAGPAASSATEVRYETGTVWATDGISSVSSTGASLAGAAVTVGFVGGGMQSAVWAASSGDAGGAFGTGWRLGVDGATYVNAAGFGPWVFEVDGGVTVAWLSIDVGPWSVFDATRTYASDPVGYPSTPGSQSGTPFAYWGMDDLFGTTATYRDAVALHGHAPVGDLYRTLTLAFETGVTDTALAFSSDTDTASTALVPVPEPGTLLLVGTGLAAAGWRGRRRRK